jgi:hypothetical protein
MILDVILAIVVAIVCAGDALGNCDLYNAAAPAT